MATHRDLVAQHTTVTRHSLGTHLLRSVAVPTIATCRRCIYRDKQTTVRAKTVFKLINFQNLNARVRCCKRVHFGILWQRRVRRSTLGG